MDKLSILLKDSLIFRILVAIGLIVMSLLPFFSEPLITVMLSFSLLILSADIILYAYQSMKEGNILNEYLLIFVGSVLLFIFNLKLDSIITVIIFQICLRIVQILNDKHIRSSQKELLESDYNEISELFDVLEDDGRTKLLMEEVMKKTCYPVFLISVGLAVIFAILMPFIHHLTVTASVERAISILIVSSPMTMLLSYKMVATSAITESGLNGIILSDVKSLEKINSINAVIIDDKLNNQNIKREIIYSHSSSMNTDSLLNFIFHVVYYSDQSYCKIIRDELDFKYHNGLVFNHLDIPNYGIKATVNNMRVIFGNEILCNKFGIDVSCEYNDDILGDYYFLCIENRCVGCVVLSEEAFINSKLIVDSFNEFNKKCFFFNEFNAENVTKKSKLSVFYPENIEKCINYLNYTISHEDYGYDAFILPDFVENLSLVPDFGNRVEEMAKHNSFISFGIKILIIILTILGFTTPWLALILDFGCAIIVMINSRNLYAKDIINGVLNFLNRFKK